MNVTADTHLHDTAPHSRPFTHPPTQLTVTNTYSLIKNTKRRKQVFPNRCTHSPVGGVEKRTGVLSAVRDTDHAGPWEPGALEAARGHPEFRIAECLLEE